MALLKGRYNRDETKQGILYLDKTVSILREESSARGLYRPVGMDGQSLGLTRLLKGLPVP